MNFLAIVVAALIPMIMGFAWYNEKAFGKIWIKETGLTKEELQKGNMAMIFGVSLFS